MRKSDFPIPWKGALEGSKRAVQNAERLTEDAGILGKNDRLESAFHLSLSAWEELGKAVLFRHWKERQDIGENQWFEILRNHRMKRIACTENSDVLYPKSVPPKDTKEVLENMKKRSKEMREYFDFERQMALYVDWVGKWRSPSTVDRRLIGSLIGSDYWVDSTRLLASQLKRVISDAEKEQSSNH